jgi:hypothetical protein
MKLLTSIKPRRDGTVTAVGADGKTLHTFHADEHGDLVCDIPDEATVTKLLLVKSGAFEPADESDFARASELVGAGGGLQDDDDEPDDDPVDLNAPPVESGTSPTDAAAGAPAGTTPPEAQGGDGGPADDAPGAPPVESGTPPKRFKPKKA